MMVLVDFAVDGLCGLFVPVRGDGLTCDGGIDSFFHSGMVTSVRSELVNG